MEFASRLSKVIDGQMDFGPAQDGLDTMASKPASAADGACGAIVEFVSRLSEVIDGQMDFGPAQDGLDTTTPRF